MVYLEDGVDLGQCQYSYDYPNEKFSLQKSQNGVIAIVSKGYLRILENIERKCS